MSMMLLVAHRVGQAGAVWVLEHRWSWYGWVRVSNRSSSRLENYPKARNRWC